MWAGLRCAQVRNAWSISPAIDDPPDVDICPSYVHLHFLQAPLAPARRIILHCLVGCNLCVRTHPSNLCLRCQLSNPKVPPSAEHSGAQLLHLRGYVCCAPATELAGDIQAGLGAAGRILDAQLLMVGHSDCTVCVHLDE